MTKNNETVTEYIYYPMFEGKICELTSILRDFRKKLGNCLCGLVIFELLILKALRSNSQRQFFVQIVAICDHLNILLWGTNFSACWCKHCSLSHKAKWVKDKTPAWPNPRATEDRQRKTENPSTALEVENFWKQIYETVGPFNADAPGLSNFRVYCASWPRVFDMTSFSLTDLELLICGPAVTFQ